MFSTSGSSSSSICGSVVMPVCKPRVLGHMLSVVVVVVVAVALLVTEATARATKSLGSEGDNPRHGPSTVVVDNANHVLNTDHDDDISRPQSKQKIAQTSPPGIAEVLNRLDDDRVTSDNNKFSDEEDDNDDDDEDNNAQEEEDDWDNDFEDSDEEDEDDDDEDYDWSEEELEEVRQKILDGLGLTTVPTRVKANVTQEEYNIAYAQYLEAVRQEEERYRNQDQHLEHTNDLADSDYRFYSTGAEHHHPG
ncbi:unnamed protein product, partial [Meganyctiphanes norvegica]